jgi:coenzyme F420-reducing hydrogenase delta subunit
MIQKKESLNSAISIIKEISRLSSKDGKRLIAELDSYSENDEFKERINDAVNKIKEISK